MVIETGRAKKIGVDYFSHDTTASGNSKTIFTLESKFGNDGYAFWFKLLEILGMQEGHFYDCSKESNWLFLVAKTRVSEISATEILNILAKMDAIDAKLWSRGVIWSQNYVDRLTELYRKRGIKPPERPVFADFCDGNAMSDGVSGAESTQSKVKDSKGKDNKDLLSNREKTTTPKTEFLLPMKDKSEYAISQEQANDWANLYPAVDVLQELKKMRGWLEANPARMKTQGYVLRFVTGWLSREQDKARGVASDNGAAKGPIENFESTPRDLNFLVE